MITLLTTKRKRIGLFASLFLAAPLFFSCKKESSLSSTVSETSTTSSSTYKNYASTSVSTSTSGYLLKEVWNNVSGNDVSNIPVGTTASTTTLSNTVEQSENYTGNVGERYRAYITAPTTGNYTFWIAGDDAAELWLSTSTDPNSKVKIAYTLSWTNFREFTKFSNQKSATVALKANTKYYIEVLHKQGGGGNNLSVQWQLPDNTVESPIASSRFTSYAPTTTVSSRVYTSSSVINLTGVHDITITGKVIAGGSVPAITLTNCYNVTITNCKLYNSTAVGLYLNKCKNITVKYNYFTNVSTGVYAEQTSEGGIVVQYNQFLNMQGPFPRGQFVQFNNVNGPNSSVSYNIGENILGSSYPEDGISMYESNGTSSSPIMIANNWIRGGGPSSSGGGIMLGDNGGSYLTATGNILVNPGEYGMAIAGGDHNSLTNNIIYSKQQSFTNVGLYVNPINGYSITNATVTGNKILFYNSTGYSNSWWLSSNCAAPNGWNGGTNILGASISASVLPTTILSYN